MNKTNLPLVHLARQPLQPSERPPLLIVLHGLGSNEQDLWSLAPYIDGRFTILSARAPLTLGYGSYAWFNINWRPDGSIAIDQAQAMASYEQLVRFVEQAPAAYGADPERVFLLGFSQGAIMSLAVTQSRPELVAGTVLLSSSLATGVPIAAPEQLEGKPVLVLHGTADPVLPIAHGRAVRDFLSGLPVKLDYREYQMGHEVNTQSLEHTLAWLSARLDGKEQQR